MRLALLALATGCSILFQKKLPSDYNGHTEPQCSTNGGLAVLDGVLAVADLGGAILWASAPPNGTSSSDQTELVVLGVAEGVLFTVSALAGAHWVGECRDAQEKWSAHEDERLRQETLGTAKAAAPPIPPPRPPTERKILVGDKPLFCTVQLADDEQGSCFLEADECVAERERLGDAMGPCGVHHAGACFNATIVLDGKRVTFCAPSVKACERRREEVFADPDFTAVTEKCGVYRVKTQVDQGSGAP